MIALSKFRILKSTELTLRPNVFFLCSLSLHWTCLLGFLFGSSFTWCSPFLWIDVFDRLFLLIIADNIWGPWYLPPPTISIGLVGRPYLVLA